MSSSNGKHSDLLGFLLLAVAPLVVGPLVAASGCGFLRATVDSAVPVPRERLWDAFTVAWGAAAGLASLLALVAWWNRRCPRCASTMTVHEPSSAGYYTVFMEVVFALTNPRGPRLQCPICGTCVPLKRPRDAAMWLAVAGGCAVLEAYVLVRRLDLV